jgi:hypothetical protein
MLLVANSIKDCTRQPSRFVAMLIAGSLKAIRLAILTNCPPNLGKSVPRNVIQSCFSDMLSKALFAAILRTERRLLRRIDRHKDHLDSFDLSSLVPGLVTIRPITSSSGLVFDPSDVAIIRELDLDLLIRCGDAPLRGDILRASKLGIISFRHAENRINRGSPPGFWEAYLRHDTTGFTLERLTEQLNGNEVLMRGHFPTYWHFLLNQAALFEKSNYYLKLLIDKVARLGKLPGPLRNVPCPQELLCSPRTHEAIIYMMKFRWRLTKRFWKTIFGVDYRWGVAYTRSDWPNAVLWRCLKVKTPPSYFLADPFVISSGNNDFCFVEEYDYVKCRGKIAVYDIAEGTRIGTALEESFHLSFPFLFNYNDQLFMCPETGQKKEVRIYRCVEFPLRWTLEKIIMRNTDAVDTMLFEKDGKWWMFTNIDPIESGDHCSELFIFFADSPFASNWTPHPLNPIFVDASCARNGGLVRNGQSFFRISQGQAFDFYGKRVRINEIVQLTEEGYKEICIGEITPNFEKGVLGIHHLHSNGKITVFDFVTLSRVSRGRKQWVKLYRMFRIQLGRVFRRMSILN